MKDMRKILLGMAVALTVIMMTGCGKSQSAVEGGQCRIHGTISQQYNDKRIFLVPLTGPQTAEYVDSIEVKDGKFEFTTDTLMMAKILVDYHYRMGVQPLLVVTEPGDVQVTIGEISSATGTPQNDSLQQWKMATETHNSQLMQLRQQSKDEQADSVHQVYKRYTRQLAKNLEGTLLGDFLGSLYPLTYKRQNADGRIVTINADTNEEIAE